jgi:predicted transcriptional regulator
MADEKFFSPRVFTPNTKGGRRSLTFRVPVSMAENLRIEADKKFRSQTSIVLQAVQEYLVRESSK